MSDVFLDPPRRNNRDQPPLSLADGVTPQNRVYRDSITLAADLVRRDMKEETAARDVLTCTAPVSGASNTITLKKGYTLILDGTGEVPASGLAQTLVIDLSEETTAAAVAAKIASAVTAWSGLFTTSATGAALGIYDYKGSSAIEANSLDWVTSSANVSILRPGVPEECIPGYYNPLCPFLMLVDVRLTGATDTHATFSRTWQVDLKKFGELESVNLDAVIERGRSTSQSLQKPLAPPSQFVKWIKTTIETEQARRGAEPDNTTEIAGSQVSDNNLAASQKSRTKQEWGDFVALTVHEIDMETGGPRETTQEAVAAGTAATAMAANGKYATVQDVDELWAIKTTVQAAGLAGQAVNGVASRAYGYRDNYSWPRVLNYIEIQALLSDPSDIYSPVSRYAWRPVWLTEGYDGPCDYIISEKWTLKKPIIGGNPDWTSASPDNVSPELPYETAIIQRDVDFQGSELNISLPRCLHGGLWIRDSQFFQEYPPSVPMRWPASILARVTLTPESGGWLTRVFIVNAPNIDGQGTGITLTQTGAASTGFTLSWTEGEGGTELDISTSPTFDGGFLEDYNGADVTGLATLAITGATRGTVYYARIRRGVINSNLCTCAAKPMAELGVFNAGQPLVSGGSQSIGQVVVGESGTYTLTLRNIGLRTLSDVEISLSGTDADLITLGTVPVSIAPGSAVDLEIQFDPDTAGVKTALLTIASNDAATPFLLTLTGDAADGEIKIEQPAGTEILAEGTVNFGTVTTTPSSKVFKVLNVGTAPLRNIAVSLAGTNANDFTVSADITTDTLGANGFTNFTLTFQPLADEGSPNERAATLLIASDDSDENPYEVNLTGLYQDPLAAGALDLTYDPDADGEIFCVAVQADGKTIIGGSFLNVDGTARNRCARINTDGAVDSFNPNVNGNVLAIAIQPDGSLILAGDFTTVGGNAQSFLARVDSTGAFDGGFTPALDDEVRALAIQADGKILLGGDFTTVNTVSKSYLARVNSDDTLDAGFTSEVDGPVNGIVLTTAGKVLIVGDWAGDMPTPTPTPPATPTPTPSVSPTPPASPSPTPSPMTPTPTPPASPSASVPLPSPSPPSPSPSL